MFFVFLLFLLAIEGRTLTLTHSLIFYNYNELNQSYYTHIDKRYT
jgi:hypothetical protein